MNQVDPRTLVDLERIVNGWPNSDIDASGPNWTAAASRLRIG
ncbi:hypothetical protein [Mesorhizobium onobrychidis]|uniref:Transposase domain-containing protein n=1 Tax=Mesorhizobium onobrychidis TaxID=2775404 RepID=A0ABY5QZ38_9HYPH|nr:hypothetical protein [Mesorhizobium onobrychidis]UVC15327.1 transposase domain-containing protein [Mesorhizobium onobrychidis]